MSILLDAKNASEKRTIIIGLPFFCYVSSRSGVVNSTGAIGGVSSLWWGDVSNKILIALRRDNHERKATYVVVRKRVLYSGSHY